MIDWAHFTPWSSLAGGLLIGVATAMFLLFNARIAGISGILGGLFRPMAGDIGAFAFRLAATRPQAILGGPMRLPTARHIDRRLVLGGLAFGAGWGLAGYCPGPALASLATGGVKPLIFTIAMLAGMAIFEIQDRFSQSPAKKAA